MGFNKLSLPWDLQWHPVVSNLNNCGSRLWGAYDLSCRVHPDCRWTSFAEAMSKAERLCKFAVLKRRYHIRVILLIDGSPLEVASL
jgi:hypothetical protein